METQEIEGVAGSTNNTDAKIQVMDESNSDSERETEQALNEPEHVEEMEINDNEGSGVSSRVDIHDENRENHSQPAGHSADASQDRERMNDRKMRPKIHQFAEYQLKDSDEWKQVQVISRVGKKDGKYDSWYNVKDLSDLEYVCVCRFSCIHTVF